MKTLQSPNWICAQIGAREHYAIPCALQQAGRAVTLCTDFWAGPAIRKLGFGKLRSLAARYHPALPGRRLRDDGSGMVEVRSWNLRALRWELILRKQDKENGNQYHGFIEVGRRFARCVGKDLKQRKDLTSGAIFYAYDTGALEAFEWCQERGIKCILNQMDPNRVEVNLVQAEELQWPGWAMSALQVPEAYFKRREQEWALADRVVVNSDFTRRALLQQGVPAEKLVVIPLCFEVKTENRNQKSSNTLPNPLPGSERDTLRVLWLGQVNLRKGIQYLIAAAKALERDNIRFDVVGPIGISHEAVATAPRNVTFHGRVARDQAADWYRQADVFVLPTLSDGFALTQLEAMAHGLPVVTTPCCGGVVTDGVDGFIVPPREVEALVHAFQRYLTEPALLPVQSEAALRKSKEFSMNRLVENLLNLETELG